MRLASRAISTISFALALALTTHSTGVFASPVEANAPSKKEPVLLKAQQVNYDQKNNRVAAVGDVEIAQGQTIILADMVAYDLNINRVYAKGNISVLQPSGDVMFADKLEFQDDLREGVIHQFRARLADNSIFVANQAKKIDENVTELFKAAYTPCNCSDDEGHKETPTWNMKADHVLIDQEAQKVRYENAYFEVMDVPVFYTPYFSHATPGADNKSGLLMPSFMRSQNLGTVFQQPVYYSIAPDKDVTFTPIYQSIAGPVMVTQYRQMFDSGSMELEGSLAHADRRNNLGNRINGHELRGHYKLQGDFRIDNHYNWGFDMRRASDDTYLRLYNFSNDILLTSRAYAEGQNFIDNEHDRTYASVESLSFQGLTGQDNRSVIPMVLPLVNFTHQTNPGWQNSRFQMDGNFMSLYRDNGSESRRLSGSVNWRLPYISDNGQVIEFTTGLRSDVYHVNNVLLTGGRDFDGLVARQVPQASLSWRYPMINYFEGGSLLIEPIIEAYYTPNGNNSAKIPNEDSLFPELTDSNLFSWNRYAGLDRVETGLRTSYGLRAFAQVMQDKYIDMLFGQSWRENDDRTFPYANNLTSQTSDYVGKVSVTSHPLTLSYRFRLNSDNFNSRRSEVNANLNAYPVSLSASYLSIQNDPVLQTKEVLAANSSVNVTRNWSWVTSSAHDLLADRVSAAYTGFAYTDECSNVTFMAGKDYTNLQDIRPATTFWLTVSLRNLE